ncbi:MAG: hypothetical protein ACPGVH_04820 [Chitinophagales bacterium]
MKFFIPLFIIVLSFTSCKKDKYFEATVLEKGSCGQRLLQFEENLSNVTESISNIYMCNELPEIMQITGLKIRIKYREPQNDEYFLCPDFGIKYKQIFITNIEE